MKSVFVSWAAASYLNPRARLGPATVYYYFFSNIISRRRLDGKKKGRTKTTRSQLTAATDDDNNNERACLQRTPARCVFGVLCYSII